MEWFTDLCYFPDDLLKSGLSALGIVIGLVVILDVFYVVKSAVKSVQ